jgi:hypothetical protein
VSRVTGQLSALPSDPLQATSVASPAVGIARLRTRTTDGVLEVNPTCSTDRLILASASGVFAATAVTAVLGDAERHSGRHLAVTDIQPPAPGDHGGLSAFDLVVGWMVGGYLVASILGMSSRARAANVVRASVRLAGIAVCATITSLLGTLIVSSWVHALPSQLIGLWWLGALAVFAAAAFTTALMALAGTVGIGLAVALLVALGNPSEGGAYVWPLPGAAVDAARGIAYFGGTNITTDRLVINGYAGAGHVATYPVMFQADRWCRRQPSRHRTPPPEFRTEGRWSAIRTSATTV